MLSSNINKIQHTFDLICYIVWYLDVLWYDDGFYSRYIMIPAERQAFIYQLACKHQLLTIESLAKNLDVSLMTIRRDIQTLEAEGKIIAVRGGLKIKQHALLEEPSYCEKQEINTTQKVAIGIAAGQLIEPGQTIYLDAGTTAFEIAKTTADRAKKGEFTIDKPLTIISNDFSIINCLMNQQYISLFHSGGEVDQRNGSTTGSYAANFIKEFNIDLAFISTSSWDVIRGISTPIASKSIIKRALLSSECECVLISDSSKYGKYSRFKISELEQFSHIVTDDLLPMFVREEIARLGIHLIIASSD